MPLTEDVHATVDRYRRDAGHAASRIAALRADVEALALRLAPGGLLGDTADPDLVRARQRLAAAAARIATAAEAVAASPSPARSYTARAFPR